MVIHQKIICIIVLGLIQEINLLDIHHACVEHGGEGEQTNYVQGANIAGFVKVADAMLSQGVI